MRLITFLGIGTYSEVEYQDVDKTPFKSCFVAHAIARLRGVDEVRVITTQDAMEKNGEAIKQAFSNDSAWSGALDFDMIPDGRTDEERWKQFQTIVDLLRTDEHESILIDITHGFRAQPFFAASALAFLRMSGNLAGKDLKILYGEFKPGETIAPIWDITLHLDLLDWAHGAGLFVKTGNASKLLEVAKREEKAVRSSIAASGGRDFPKTSGLISALKRVADDLATIRVASLVTGYEQDESKKEKARSSAAELVRSIDEYTPEVARHLPPLAILLEALKALVEPLVASRLSGPEGHEAMRALAGLYLQFERYPEVAVVVREALVSKYAEKRVEGVEVNSSAFSSAERSNAERHWQCADPDASRSIADIRNDIEHAGFREQPMGGEKLKDRVSDMLEKLGELSVDMAAQPHGKTVLVTRHAGARDWVEQEGHQVDDLIVHLDPEMVQKGDKVIGTLPINLINEVCERGARYFHLTLELQAEHRGRELTAEDMRRCGARLMEYRVQGVTDK